MFPSNFGTLSLSTLKKSSNMPKIWQQMNKTIFQLALKTHFSTDFGYPRSINTNMFLKIFFTETEEYTWVKDTNKFSQQNNILKIFNLLSCSSFEIGFVDFRNGKSTEKITIEKE